MNRATLKELHEANGCVNIRKLAPGTRVVLHTTDECFEFEVGTPERGVVLVGSEYRYPMRDKVIVEGSFEPRFRVLIPHIIGRGLLVVLRHRNNKVVKTPPVERCVVKGENYEYSLWDEDIS